MARRLVKFLSLLLLLLCGNKRLTAQVIELGNEQSLSQPIPLYLNYASFYIDSAGALPVESIAAQTFQPYSHYFPVIPKHLPVNKATWLKFQVQSNYATDTSIIFYPGFQNNVTMYYAAGGRFTKIAEGGNLIPASKLTEEGMRQAISISLPARVLSTYFISIMNSTEYHVSEFKPYLMSKAMLYELQGRLQNNNKKNDIVFFIGIGMFLIMFIYIFIKWLYQKDIAYLYYAITIAFGAAFFIANYQEEENNLVCFSENPLINYLLSDFFLFISLVAYWQFVRHFLYIDAAIPKLSAFIQRVSYAIAAFAVVSLFYGFAYKNLMGIGFIDSVAGVVIIIGGIYVFFSIRKIRSRLRNFIYGGMLCLIFFSSLASLYEALKNTQWEIFKNLSGSMPLVMMGKIGEMLFFTFGLAYRNKLEMQEQTDLRLQMANAEMKALRAQMNPHFIFNCMHIIDAYIFKQQPENASRFLNKFSKLIRQVLENSSQPLIVLQKELDSLSLFTELEQERYDNSFDVSFDVSQKLLNDNYKIPPLLIQPYVENAILHGLRHKKGERGKLKISVEETTTDILIIIADNGIGRIASQNIKALNGIEHTSMALELTQQRLNMLPQKGSVQITDYFDAHTEGTSVQIQLPKIL